MFDMNLKLAIEEIETKFFKLLTPSQKKRLQTKNYMAKYSPSEVEYLGHNIPSLRSIIHDKKLMLYQLSFDEQFKVLDYFWNTKNTFDEMALSLFWLEKQNPQDLLKIDKKILKWRNRIDNWAHSDSYCGVLAKMIDYNFASSNQFLLREFKKMNQHQNPWFRRISIVGLLYYSRLRKNLLSFNHVIEQVDNLLTDDHYYVQKGVGWVLRELYNVYPKETLQYLHENVQNIAPAGWYAASEKLSVKNKQALLKKRKSKKIK